MTIARQTEGPPGSRPLQYARALKTGASAPVFYSAGAATIEPGIVLLF